MPRFAILFLVLALFAAACGGDDGDADDATDSASDASAVTDDGDAMDDFFDPTAIVSTQACHDAIPDLLGGANESPRDWWERLQPSEREDVFAWTVHAAALSAGYSTLADANDSCKLECPHIPGHVVVDSYVDNEIIEQLLADVVVSDADTQPPDSMGLKLVVLDGATSLAAADALQAAGLRAAPNYLLLPAQGNMLFPGGFPLNVGNVGGVSMDAVDAVLPIHVLDTGYTPADPNSELHEEDVLFARTDIGNRAFAGHGSFIGSIIAQQANSPEVNHWRLTNSAIWDEVALAWAVERAMETTEDPIVANLSLGARVCNGDAAKPILLGAALMPLLAHDASYAAVAAGLMAQDNDLDPMIGYDDRVYPAAMPADELEAAWQVAICRISSVPADCADAGLCRVDVPVYPEPCVDEVDDLEGQSVPWAASDSLPSTPPIDRVVGVGASDIANDGVGYSFVDITATGCHLGWYQSPTTFSYPVHGGTDSLADVVEWCGTSFATAQVTALLANGMDVAAAQVHIDTQS